MTDTDHNLYVQYILYMSGLNLLGFKLRLNLGSFVKIVKTVVNVLNWKVRHYIIAVNKPSFRIVFFPKRF
jgi:hypothetical protein